MNQSYRKISSWFGSVHPSTRMERHNITLYRTPSLIIALLHHNNENNCNCSNLRKLLIIELP